MSDLNRSRFVGLWARGLCMGLAEVVPGVSGGTIAFVTGIYHELVAALATFGPRSLSMIASPKQFYEHHHLGFLLSLAFGMGCGILLFAQVMQFLLLNAQPLVWSFFAGVIAASVWVIGAPRRRRELWLAGPLGLLAGILLLFAPNFSTQVSLMTLFLGGAIAVCAWLLPAISGSYVLLTLGLYQPVITAVAQLQWLALVAIAAGCTTGILLFSRALAWMLKRHQEWLLSGLTGFMLGSLPKLWPWQASDSWVTPSVYVDTVQQSAFVYGVPVCFLFGVAALWVLSRTTNHT